MADRTGPFPVGSRVRADLARFNGRGNPPVVGTVVGRPEGLTVKIRDDDGVVWTTNPAACEEEDEDG